MIPLSRTIPRQRIHQDHLTVRHSRFLTHDLSKGKGRDSAFSAGGGGYTLKDSVYTEHLAFCNDRQWEGNDFQFTVTIKMTPWSSKALKRSTALV